MPKLTCCLPYCKTQMSSASNPPKIGSPQFWPQFISFVENGEQYDKLSVICTKHHAQVCKLFTKSKCIRIYVLNESYYYRFDKQVV